MLQDQQLLAEFRLLPPESKNEVLDFIRYLQQKQQRSVQELPKQRLARLQKAAQVFAEWQTIPLPAEEEAVWLQLEQESIPKTECREPDPEK